MSVCRSLAGILTPVYLALIGFSAVKIGALVLAVGISSAVLSSLIGLLSDRIGRRPFLVALPLVTALAGVAFAVSRDTAVLMLAAAAGSFGRGAGVGAGMIGPYQPAESALVTDGVPAAARNRAFGRLAFASSVGAVAGGLLALTVTSTHPHGAAATAAFRVGFLLTSAGAGAAGLLALLLREPRQTRVGRRRLPRIVLPRRSRPLLLRLWLTNGMNGLAVGMFGPFVTYWFFRRFGASVSQIGVLFALINAVTSVGSLSAAGLARRWGLIRTLTAVRMLQGALLIPMVLSPTFPLAGAFLLLRMVAQRIGLPLRQSYVLAMADPAERGAVGALSNLPAQALMAASPPLSGYLFDTVSLSLPFEIAGVLQMLNALVYWAFFRDAPPEEERRGGGITAAGRAYAPWLSDPDRGPRAQ